MFCFHVYDFFVLCGDIFYLLPLYIYIDFENLLCHILCVFCCFYVFIFFFFVLFDTSYVFISYNLVSVY